MPRVKSVKSLTEICIDMILENQNIFCKKFPFRQLEDCADALDLEKPAVNPFDELPSELLEELIRVLRKRESSEVYPNTYNIAPLLKLLVTPRLCTLDLTAIDKDKDISDVLHLATIRSPNLKTLRLDSFPLQYRADFNFIPKFVKLRTLEISFREASDDCFYLIGKHCPDLRELNCKGCQATDNGILKLCVVGNCKSIRKLNLEECSKITIKGIQLALDNLPQLTVLCHESLLESLAEIAETGTDKKLTLPKYSLSALYILPDTVYKSGSLRQSVLLCPNVTEVYLTMYTRGLKDADLLSLLSLEKLYTIEIKHCIFHKQLPGEALRIDRDLSFDGVIPLLKKFGICLKKLTIGYCFVVEIPVIVEFCPYLESLILENCETTQSAATKVKRPRLKKLKKIILRNYSTITSENLFTLLSSPSLSYIELSMINCNALTDDVLHRAAKIHSFRNLESLHLYHCNLVTKNGIDIFLQEFSPLREIMLFCDSISGITKEDIIDWNNNPIWIQKNWQFNFILTCLYKNIYLGGHIWEGHEGRVL